MIDKKTVVDQIEITRRDVVQVRLALMYVEDGVEGDQKYHRTAIPPGVEPELQMQAVHEHLASMGYPPVSGEDMARIEAHCKIVHTADAIERYRANLRTARALAE